MALTNVSTKARAEQLLDMFLEDHEVPEELQDDLLAEIEVAVSDVLTDNPAITRQSYLYDELVDYLEAWLDENTAPEDGHPAYTPMEILILGGWVDDVTCMLIRTNCNGCPIVNECPMA